MSPFHDYCTKSDDRVVRDLNIVLLYKPDKPDPYCTVFSYCTVYSYCTQLAITDMVITYMNILTLSTVPHNLKLNFSLTATPPVYYIHLHFI